MSLNLHECENEKIINEIFDPRSSHLSCRPLPSGLQGVLGDEPQVPVVPPSVSVAGCWILSCLLTGEDSALRSRVQQQQPCVLWSPVSGLVWSSWNLRQEATNCNVSKDSNCLKVLMSQPKTEDLSSICNLYLLCVDQEGWCQDPGSRCRTRGSRLMLQLTGVPPPPPISISIEIFRSSLWA